MSIEIDTTKTEETTNVDWNYICYYQKLSESFIREFQDKVNWEYISRYQALSENFICEFKDKVDWSKIHIHRDLYLLLKNSKIK